MPGPELESSTCQAQAQNADQIDTCNAVGNGHVENKERPKISTLVFMDLETTGLPSDVGKRNVHITEMCLLAVDRNSFEVDKRLRVLNKISLCVRPRFNISPGSMMVTDLYNDMLESQEEFDDSIPKLLEYFFRRLQKPICLLAHNGNRFDFPVLQAELNRLNFSLGSDIVCADTLVAFRSICLSQKQTLAAEAQKKAKEEEMQSELVKPCESISISEEDIDDLLSQDLESFSYIDDSLISVEEKTLEPALSELVSTKTRCQVDETPEKKPVQIKEFLSPTRDEKTPEKSKITVHINEKKQVRKRKVLDPTFLPKNQYKYNKKRVVPAKRTLFPELDNDMTPLEIDKITRFSLENLYNHFFNENPPNSHYAETDCVSLSKVCQKISRDFLQWVDENSVTFSTIDAMW